MFRVFAAIMFLVVTGARAEEPTDWHLLAKSRGGTVSLLKNLTKSQCEYSRARILGLPATPEEKLAAAEQYKRLNPICPQRGSSQEQWAAWSKQHPGAQGCVHADGLGASSWGGWRHVSNGDIESAQCFQ